MQTVSVQLGPMEFFLLGIVVGALVSCGLMWLGIKRLLKKFDGK